MCTSGGHQCKNVPILRLHEAGRFLSTKSQLKSPNVQECGIKVSSFQCSAIVCVDKRGGGCKISWYFSKILSILKQLTHRYKKLS